MVISGAGILLASTVLRKDRMCGPPRGRSVSLKIDLELTTAISYDGTVILEYLDIVGI